MGELKRRGQIWWIRYYKNGKRCEESSGSTKEAEAKSLLRLREGDIERGVALTPKVGRIRFDEGAKDVLNDYRTNRKRSLDDVERRIELHLKPFFGNRRMASITTTDIREYIDSRQKETTVPRNAFTFTARDGTPRHLPEQRRTITGVSNAEINRELTTLKRMFNLAVQAGKLLQKPHIPFLKEDNVRVGFFERDQFLAVFAHLAEVAAGRFRRRRSEARSGEDEERRGAHVPETRELREVLEQQRAITENLQRQLKVVCPWSSIARAGRSRAFASHSGPPVRRPGVRGASCTTSAERPSAISSAPGFPSAWRCR